jgi:hypothetical protein
MRAVAKLTQLQHLEMAYCEQITDMGIRSLSVLHSLVHLNLDACNSVTDRGIRTLAKLPHLRHLSLRIHQITRKGLAILSEYAQLETLELDSLGDFDSDMEGTPGPDERE